jgi:diguanylate cyclase (GGDEF)-like protein
MRPPASRNGLRRGSRCAERAAAVGPLRLAAAVGTLLALAGAAAASGQPPAPSPAPSPAAALPSSAPVLEVALPRDASEAAALFDRWSSADGLSQDAVFALAADPRGFVWAGTEGGLDRFDGHRFEPVRRDGTAIAGLPHDFVWSLSWGAAGMWIGTNGGGLALYRPELERIDTWPALAATPAHRWVLSVLETRDGTVWAGTRGGGVVRAAWPGGSPEGEPAVRVLGTAQGLPGETVRALVEGRDGGLWLGTDGGLARLRPGGTVAEPVALVGDGGAEPVVAALVMLPGDELWVATRSGLFRLDAAAGRVVGTWTHRAGDPRSLPSDALFSLAAAADGAIWAGSDRGLARVDRRSGEVVRVGGDAVTPGPSGDEIMALLATADGAIWAGTFNQGIARFDPAKGLFVTQRPDPQRPDWLSPHRVRALLEDRHGAVWVGTVGGGLHKVEPWGAARWLRAGPGGIPHDNVWALLERRDGDVLAATDAGLSRIRGDAAPQTMLRPPAGALLRALVEGPDGTLWVAGASGVLRLPPRGSPEPVPLADAGGRPLLDIYSLLLDPDGTLWAGSWNGLCRRDPGEIVRCWDRNSSPALPDALVWALHRDRSGRLWAGTNGGLVRIAEGDRGGVAAFRSVGEREGLPSNVVYAILEDDEGGLWLSTNRGLARWHPDARPGDPARGIRVFDESDGLASTELSFGAAHRGRSGRLYVGGKSGFSAFTPEEVLLRGSPPPRPLLIGLRLGDQPVPVAPPAGERQVLRRALHASDRLRLSWNDPIVAFHFAAPEFRAPGRLRFQYRLEGFDPGWRAAGDDRVATYTNLDPGDYRLRVRVTDPDGRWSPHEVALPVVVAPPWWATWWFRLLAGLGLVAVVVGGYRVRIHALQTRRRELEALVGERTEALAVKTRELEEKNEQLYELSVRDRLTGVHNRGYATDMLTRLVAEAARYRRPMAAVLLDLDRFKAINDRHGHAAGDAVLRAAASRLKRRLRQTDLVARWGGEELLVLLPETTLETAVALAEELRAELAAEPVDWDGTAIPVTASFGVAACDGSPAETPEGFLHRADVALYEAKEAGRNRVEVATAMATGPARDSTPPPAPRPKRKPRSRRATG